MQRLMAPALVWLGAAMAMGADFPIMTLGDSIAWGFPVEGGYRTELVSQLEADGFPIVMIGTQQANASPALSTAGQAAHEGHNGYKIAEIGANLTGDDERSDSNGGLWLRRAVVPQAILLMIGTNDILVGESSGMVGRLEMLISRIFAELPTAHLLVSNILPITLSGKNDEVLAYNMALRDEVIPMFAALGCRIVFVDQYANFVDANGAVISERLPDGIHPDASGYEAMGITWAQAVSVLPALRYERWRRLTFSAAQAESDAISGAAADFDDDGLPNGGEFYYGSDPKDGLVEAEPAFSRGEDADTLTWTWRRSMDAAGVPTVFESSESLAPGSWQPLTPTSVDSLAPDPSTGYPRFRATFETNEGPRFFLRQVFPIQ